MSFIAWAAMSDINAQPSQQNAVVDKLRDLHTRRRDVLRERVDNAAVEYENGVGSYEALIAAKELVLQAELELTTMPDQRLAVFRQRVDNFRALEQHAAVLFKSGMMSTNQVLLATANRLQAEIDYVGEESKVD